MKAFIGKYRKIIIFSVTILLAIVIFTTATVTNMGPRYSNKADGINTCSVPTGEIKAKGIDVSKYQQDIDFAKVKEAGYSFVILRVGTTIGGKDPYFETYYKEASAQGLDIGCYFYTYATTVKKVTGEANKVLEMIKGKDFTYPVFLDFEYPELLVTGRNEKNTKMIDSFCTQIRRGGYYPGVYLSHSVFKNHINTLEIGNKWDVWVASYHDYTGEYMGYSKSFSMWQYSNKGSVPGINADVDMNLCYVDYPSIIDGFNRSYISLYN